LASNEKIHEYKLMHIGLVHSRFSANIQSQLPSSYTAYSRRLCAGALAFILLSLCGCNRDEISSYRIPKEKSTESMVAETAPVSAPAQVHWVTPPGWVELPASGMRAGGFKISTNGETAEVSIVPMPGVSGIELDSVNMWRQTLGLPALDAAGFAKIGENTLVGKTTARLFDLAAADGNTTNKNRTIGAIANNEGSLWFFKITGDNHLVAQEKPAFQDFLKSITFSPVDAANVAAAPFAKRAMGPVDRQAPENPISGAGHAPWKTPDGWIEQPTPSMLLASYSVPGKAGGKADVTVSMFPGDVGGVLANVNRWRRQLGLPPVTENDLSKTTSQMDVGNAKATVVDMTGQDGAKAMYAMIVPRDGNTWFYKMTGDPAALADQKKSFVEFAGIAH
jgi:hypothetical protein